MQVQRLRRRAALPGCRRGKDRLPVPQPRVDIIKHSIYKPVLNIEAGFTRFDQEMCTVYCGPPVFSALVIPQHQRSIVKLPHLNCSDRIDDVPIRIQEVAVIRNLCRKVFKIQLRERR